jgi:hypothetical protein
MQDLATERDHLVLAERHISEGESRIAQQAGLVQRLHGAGQQVAAAQMLLENFEQILESWKDHRDLILTTIVRLETERDRASQP